MSVTEIRFAINDQPVTDWEPEAVRHRALGATPTAVQRITELRQRFPEAAITVERRGDFPRRPDMAPMSRFMFYVRSGSMPVNDPNGVKGISIAQIENQTLFSRPFAEAERDNVRAAILERFPNVELMEVKA